MAASAEAVSIRRELAAARPDAYRPDLAASLTTLADGLSDLGRAEEAVAAAEEAVSTFRELAAARPDAYRPDLATWLNNLADGLSNLERAEEALAAAEEAVSTFRELAAVQPDAYRPDLATSLTTLADGLSNLGRAEEAVAAAEEAVSTFRELAVRWPDAYHHELEQSLQVAARLEQGEDLSGASPQEPRSDNGPLSGLPPTLGRSNALDARRHDGPCSSMIWSGSTPFSGRACRASSGPSCSSRIASSSRMPAKS